jgi:hypothetical protein
MVYALFPPVSSTADPSPFLLGMTPLSRVIPNVGKESAVEKIGGKR